MVIPTKVDIKLKQFESTVIEFINKKRGFFLLATHDTTFISVFKNTIVKHLAIESDCVVSIQNEHQIIKNVKDCSSKSSNVLLFIEQVFDKHETGVLIKEVKNAFPSVKIIILTSEAEKQRLVLLHEIGADNFISKPISVNTLIEKIAFTVKPQGKLGQLIDKAKKLNSQGNYDNALKIGRQLLEMKPNSAAAFLILGDSYRGMGKAEKAIESYNSAVENAPLFLEPLKKMAEFFETEGNQEEQLKYLEKLDSLSPLNVERKVNMGEIHMDLGNDEQAEEIFDKAVKQAKKRGHQLY